MGSKKLTQEELYDIMMQAIVVRLLRKINDKARDTLRAQGNKA